MLLNFDASQYAPSTGGESVCLPLNDYPFAITAVEGKQVKDNPNSGYLEVSLTIQAGDYKGTVQKDRFNIYNQSEKARAVAFSELSSLCYSIGRLQIQDSQQLVGAFGIATIGPQKDNDKYSEVKVYKDVQGRINGMGEPVPAPTAPAPAQQAQQTQQAPWSAPQTSGNVAPAQQQAAPPWAASAAPPAPVQQQQPPAPPAGQQQPPWGQNALAVTQQAPAPNAPPWAQAQPQQQAAPPWAK